jgi:hypothetical protein
MKKFKLKGRYNTFSNSYNKSRVYFTISNNLENVIVDLYRMGLAAGKISINDSEQADCEVAEINVKGDKATIVFQIEVNEASLLNIAKYAFDRNVEITLSYGEEKVVERISSQYYRYLINLMGRVSSGVGMGSTEELRVLINQTYGYAVPINENMRKVDAVQLRSLLAQYAEDNIPGFVDYEPNPDAFVSARMNRGKCAVCDKPYTSVKDGYPLCAEHLGKLKDIGLDRFKSKYYL